MQVLGKTRDFIRKYLNPKGAGGGAQVVECCIASAGKKEKRKKIIYDCS
jgi:hypothetical protein